jgi:transcriptional antiterminator NusG
MFKWYVVQAYSSCEKAVKNSINQRAEKAGMDNLIKEILVPAKKVIEVRKSKKVEVEKNLFPGYVLLHAELSNELWHLIKSIPKVTGFISQSGDPVPLKQAELDNIMTQLEDDNLNLSGEIEFEIGETVRVIDGGPFDGFSGVIEGVDTEKKSIVVSVSIFGRATPVNLAFNQVERE